MRISLNPNRKRRPRPKNLQPKRGNDLLKPPAPPPPSATLITQAATVRKLWKRKRADGAEVDATIWYHAGLGATLEINIHAAHGEAELAEGIADGVRLALDADEERGKSDERHARTLRE